MKALILVPFHPDALARLREHGEVVYESWLDTGTLTDPEELGARLSAEGFDVLITEADFVFEETFAAAPNLKFVGVCRGETGAHVDVDAATQRGVLVVNTPGRNAVAVAELTIGLMVSLARRIPAADAMIHAGQWQSAVDNLTQWQGVELAGKTAGLVGLGAVGREVAKRLAAFGTRVIATDPHPQPFSQTGRREFTFSPQQREEQSQVDLVPLNDLLRQSDFVSLHCPLNAETKGMIGARELARMQPSAFLVNTARAAIVDEAALIAALREKRIAGAGLDVHLVEPLPPNSPWLALPNVILTPHIGGATADVVRHHSEMIVADVERWLRGERPVNWVKGVS
jgi:phosphoglycerate dehydrogenase-like enzyme